MLDLFLHLSHFISDKSNFCVLNHKMNFLALNALLSEKDKYPVKLFPDADGTDYDKFVRIKEIQKGIKNFVNEGKNLVIYSKTTGNGKSASAKKLVLAYFASIIYESDYECKGLYISVPRFFNELKTSISKETDYISYIKENIIKADIVLWDEIGVKDITTFEHDQFLNFLNMRLENGKSNIFTSNMTPIELKTKLGDRLYSRIIQTSELIELKGMDKRGLSQK